MSCKKGTSVNDPPHLIVLCVCMHVYKNNIRLFLPVLLLKASSVCWFQLTRQLSSIQKRSKHNGKLWYCEQTTSNPLLLIHWFCLFEFKNYNVDFLQSHHRSKVTIWWRFIPNSFIVSFKNITETHLHLIPETPPTCPARLRVSCKIEAKTRMKIQSKGDE